MTRHKGGSEGVWKYRWLPKLIVMRKFLSSTAGATFNQKLATQTLCVRKDCVELIYKVKPSVYVIVSLHYVGDSEVMLFVRSAFGTLGSSKNWRRYFDRLQNPQVQMPRIEQNCPTLYAVMTGDDSDGVYECDCRPDGTMYHGFSLKMAIPANLALVECVSKEVLTKAVSWLTRL